MAGETRRTFSLGRNQEDLLVQLVEDKAGYVLQRQSSRTMAAASIRLSNDQMKDLVHLMRNR